ncbi:MAG: hypothetical protein JWM99_1980 [Verrucomicrobiales bacterium]|nr:hypothetical protein [Verrucomicrobiales bacterium]
MLNFLVQNSKPLRHLFFLKYLLQFMCQPAQARFGGILGLFITIPVLAGSVFAETAGTNWQASPFWCLQTELSPATLVFSKDRDLHLFNQSISSPVGPPSHIAIGSPFGLVISTNDLPVNTSTMSECWAVVWFSGSRGWTNWDVPWLIAFQHKPLRLRVDDTGVKLNFAHEAGYVAIMPLYGYEKFPQSTADQSRFNGKHKLETWKWAKGLPREVVQRVRYWSTALHEFPIHCTDEISVDRGQDSVTIRQNIQWLSIFDNWNSPHIRLNPISPPLGLASLDRTFPVRFSSTPFDLDFATPYGPLLAVEKLTSVDATFPLLRFINEMEITELPPTNAPPIVTAALKKLRETAVKKFQDPSKYRYDQGGLNNFCWAIMGDAWYAKGLPYYDEPTRAIALSSLRKYFHEDVLVTNRFKLREYPKGSGHTYYFLEAPGIGSWGVPGEGGKFGADLLETLWAYAQYSGDWDLIKGRWDLVKKLFITPAETRWVGFGRDAIAELGDEAAPSLAMARMAYAVGDLDTYNYASSVFVRELTHLQLKERSAQYFRDYQPWHSFEVMDAEVYLTHLGGGTAGWRMDGPKFPKEATERLFNNRWVRFRNEDVARFYRDYWAADVRNEMDLLQTRLDPKGRTQNDFHTVPSLVQIRSLLLNEAPEALGQLGAPELFTGPASVVIASCISILRTCHPTHYARIIPKDKPSEFVAGIERESFGPSPVLTQAIRTNFRNTDREEQGHWPEITWWGWKSAGKDFWSFGQIVPGNDGSISRPETIRLNWNAQVTVYR